MKSATGQKVKKTFVKTGSPTVTTDYLDGFQYKNTVLEFFGTAEGFVDNGSYVYQYKDQLGNVRMSYDKNPVTGLARILDENHYYPYGLKHTGYGTNTSSTNAAHKYRYNSREWQDEEDLNLTAMDFRMYDNALGRFYGMDALSEKNHYLSPFQFGNGNPVFWADPTGLDSEGGYDPKDCYGKHGAGSWIKNYTDKQYNSIDAGGSGSGGGDAVNGTAQDLLNAIYKEMNRLGVNSYSINRNSNGVFWATYTIKHTSLIEGMTWKGVTGVSVMFDFGKIIGTGLWVTNTGIGITGLYPLFKGDYFLNNELWRVQKNGKIITPWSKMKNGQSYWKNNFAKTSRLNHLNSVQNMRNLSTKLSKASGVLIAADVLLSGDVKPSHWINGLMVAAAFTGVGTIAAAVWFVADFGTMGVNYLINGEAKGIGDMIDESEWGQSKTIKMYDGLY